MFLQGNKRRSIYVQAGLPVLPILSTLFQAFEVDNIGWLPFDKPDISLPVVQADIFWGPRMMFSIPEAYRLCLQEQSFHTHADTWTMVLLPERLEIHKVGPSTTVATIAAATSQDRPYSYHLCNHMLVKLQSHARPCQAIIARSVEPSKPFLDEPFDGTFLDMGDWLQARLDASEATLLSRIAMPAAYPICYGPWGGTLSNSSNHTLRDHIHIS